MSTIDDIVEILAQSPMALSLLLPNAPNKLFICFAKLRYIIGPGDEGTLGYICDRIITEKPRYVPSSFMSGTIEGKALLPHVQRGVIDIVLTDKKVKDHGVFISIHQRMVTLPDEFSYDSIESNKFIARISKYREKR